LKGFHWLTLRRDFFSADTYQLHAPYQLDISRRVGGVKDSNIQGQAT